MSRCGTFHRNRKISPSLQGCTEPPSSLSPGCRPVTRPSAKAGEQGVSSSPHNKNQQKTPGHFQRALPQTLKLGMHSGALCSSPYIVCCHPGPGRSMPQHNTKGQIKGHTLENKRTSGKRGSVPLESGKGERKSTFL